MLKNISISTEILESLGFVKVKLPKGEKRTLLKLGNKSAEVLPNGSVVINGKDKTEFKAVKKKRIVGI